MAVNTILTLGSPIKDHAAPSMLGPVVANVATVGGLSVAGGFSKTAALAGGATPLTGRGFSTASVVGGSKTAATLTSGSTATKTYAASQITGIRID